MTAAEAIALAADVFPDVVRQLRRGGRLTGVPAMVAAAREIRSQASRNWTLNPCALGRHFLTSNAQMVLRFDDALMGALLAAAIGTVRDSDDAEIAAAVAALPTGTADTVLMTELLKPFVAHEFLHVRQQLGSTQFMDSDHYAAIVTPIDYQADVAAMWYVSRRTDRPAGLDGRRHLLLLAALHVAMMHWFGSGDGEIDRVSFDRRLVWHLHLARFAASREEPDMNHASMQAMPVVSFPRADGAISELVSVARVTALANDTPDVLADMTIAMADAAGLLNILRFPSTDRVRVAEIVGAVIGCDFRASREALDELQIYHAAALDFALPDPTRIAVEQVTALAEGLVGSGASLTMSDRQVMSFFREAERLAFLPRSKLAGEGFDDLRLWWKDGVDDWLVRLIDGEAPSAEARPLAESLVLMREINRVASRMGASLDAMD